MATRRATNPAAFTLIEIVVCLGLIAFAFALAGLLFNDVLRTMRGAEAAQADGSHLDACVAQLRADVWNSRAIVCPGPQRLELTPASRGGMVTWLALTPQRTLVRQVQEPGQPLQERRWEALSAQAAFGREGVLVTLRLGRDASQTTIALASQVPLDQGAQP